MEGLDNPSYEENFMQSTQSNGNTRGIQIFLRTNTSNSQVNDTSSSVPSFIYQNDIQMEGIYSIVDGEQVGESLYNHLQGIEKKYNKWNNMTFKYTNY